jgi:hypothetical protein
MTTLPGQELCVNGPALIKFMTTLGAPVERHQQALYGAAGGEFLAVAACWKN